MRILLVEDDRSITQALERALRTQGYSVNTVIDGKSALLAV